VFVPLVVGPVVVEPRGGVVEVIDELVEQLLVFRLAVVDVLLEAGHLVGEVVEDVPDKPQVEGRVIDGQDRAECVGVDPDERVLEIARDTRQNLLSMSDVRVDVGQVPAEILCQAVLKI
jgi:hypothetical protein